MSVQRCFECVRAVRGVSLLCAVTALPSLHCGSSDSNGGPAAGLDSATPGGAGSGGRGGSGSAGDSSSVGGNSSAGENAGTGSEEGGASSAAGASAAGSGGAAAEPLGPSRLIVVGASGAMIWDDAAALDADVAPQVLLSGEVTGALAVVVDDARLAVVTDAQLVVFDDAASLTNDSTPAALLDLPELSPSLGVARAAVDGDGDLWLTTAGSILLYPAFASLGAGDSPRAAFFHEWGQIFSMTYSRTDDRLFAAQVSGAGILQLESPKTASGDVELDSSWSDLSCWGTALAGSALYCARNTAVSIWQNLPTGGPPSTTLTAGIDDPVYVDVVRDTLLVLDHGAQSVLLFQNASTLTSDAEPDVRIDDIGFPRRAWLSQSDSLYVLTTRLVDGENRRSIVIYDDVFGSPQLRTELAASQGEDVWLLE